MLTRSRLLRVRVGKGGRLRIQLNPSTFESKVLNGETTGSGFLEMTDAQSSFKAFHSYKGGHHWRPVVHQLAGMVGREVPLRVVPLTIPNLVRNLQSIVLTNSFGDRWGPQTAKISKFEAEENTIAFKVGCYATSRSFKEIMLRGILDVNVENSNGTPRISFVITGLLGTSKRLAIYYDALEPARIGIEDGRQFRSVRLIYSDSVRLRIVYEKFRAFNVSTLYVGDPSEIYGLEATDLPRGFDVDYWKCYNVMAKREIETLMLKDGTSYDHGRLGVEIAYTIAKNLFPTKKFVIPEPSRGGKDLFSSDGHIAIQARLICDFRQFRPMKQVEVIRAQLGSLLRKLNQDFRFNPKMSMGIASLSFISEKDGRLRTVLAKPRVIQAKTKKRSEPDSDQVASLRLSTRASGLH